MKLFGLVLGSLFFFSVAQASDWNTEKDVNTVLDKKGCVAETSVDVDTTSGTKEFVLQVIKLETGNGDYSQPIIVSFPQDKTFGKHYEAKAQSNRKGSPEFAFTMLQPNDKDQSIVAARMGDRKSVIQRIRDDANFTVRFLDEKGVTYAPVFSLIGSLNAVDNLNRICN